MDAWWFIALVALVAFLYSMVGHGGASGYLALMAYAEVAPMHMRSSALVINLFVSLIAFMQFARAGHFQWARFWPFALLSVPCVFFVGGIELDKATFLRLLGICVVIAGLRMLGLFAPSGKSPKEAPIVLALVLGGAIGVVAGLLGIGGGIILSPVLLVCGWADAKSAAALSAAFIFVNSAAGLIKQFSVGSSFAPELWSWVSVAVCAGVVGSWVGARKTPEPRLRQALGGVLIFASIKLIWP